jgi:tonB-linked outer membrane protein, susC/ragA family
MKKHFMKFIPLCIVIALPSIMHATQTERDANREVYVTQQQKKGRVVTGTITDANDGTPIIGANIKLKQTNTGVISDIDGNFSINVNSSRDVLVISYIGYKTREVPVENLGVINIQLTSDNEILDEVIIVGSGTQKKISVTGAITTVKGTELKAPSSSLTSSMAGRLPGVFVNTNSGEPGSTSNFYIRGVSTFGGRTTPLILLDDVEISTGDLNNIPAETIESFTVLKDASATAIYGARGANGVMLITTKSGMENSKTKIGITVENTFHTPMNFPEFVDGATWMDLYNEAQLTRNPGSTKRYNDDLITNTRNKVNPYLYPDVDWGDLIFRDMAMSQRANINVQGGGSRVTYYMSLNVNHDTGLLDSPEIYSWDNNINNLSYNFQNNIQVKLTTTTKVRLNMNAQIRKNRGPNYGTASLFAKTLYANPVNFPAYYPAQEGDTHVRFGNKYRAGNDLYTNPYADMVSSFAESNLNTLNTTLRLDQDLSFLTKGLKANALINFKNYSVSSYNRSIEPYYYKAIEGSYNPEQPTVFEFERLGTSGTEYISQSNISKTGDNMLSLQLQLDWKRRFGKHDISAMLQYMQREYRNDVLPNRNQGISGRITYDYDHRYLAEFNFGYNGTERLAKDDRFEFFPAISLGWVTSNEKFFEPLTNVISHLKLRATYGIVGSDDMDFPSNYLYYNLVSLNNQGFNFGDDWHATAKGPTVTQYAVKQVSWERAKKTDVGVDLTLFNDWNITFDYFYQKRDRILMQRAAWPKLFGYGNAVPYANVGKLDSWGYEVSTNYAKKINRDWHIDLRANFTYADNKYIFKDEPSYPYEWSLATGRPTSVKYGYVAEGLFQNEDEIAQHATQQLGSTPKVGDIKYKDLNGDGIVDKNDYGIISMSGDRPRIQYGFGANVTYKKFDFGIFFNGSALRTVAIGSGIHPFGESEYNIFKFIAEDHWTEANQNPNAKYPRLGLLPTDTKNNTVESTYWLRNGNFLRLKQVELGYSFKYGRIYIAGDNLAVFSPFKEWDPELSWNSYPLQRTFTAGLQLNF